MSMYSKVACFVGGALFGSYGLKLLSTKEAKKAYVQVTAAGLRAKDQVMETVTSLQENAADVLAEAEEINAARAAKIAAEEAEAEIRDEVEVTELPDEEKSDEVTE